MRFYRRIILVFSFLFLINISGLLAHAKDDISLIKSRYRQHLISENEVLFDKSYVNLHKGGYLDINYSDTSSTNWQPIRHLERIYAASVYMYSIKSIDRLRYQKIISEGLMLWAKRKPTSANWWYNDVAANTLIAKILLLIDNGHQYKSILKRIPEHPIRHLAMNGVWMAEVNFLDALLSSDKHLLKLSTSELKSGVKTVDAEGIQFDFSFHQHGRQLYSTGYGREFLEAQSFYAYILRKTEYQYSKKEVDLLYSVFNSGLRYFTRYNFLDFNASGREFTRENNVDVEKVLSKIAVRLGRLNPSQISNIDQFINSVKRKPGYINFNGNRYFWNSDFMSHQRADYYLSIRMVSNRTAPIETLNGENLYGGWLSYGATFLTKDEDEYKRILPMFNWARVPGVTSSSNYIRNRLGYKELNQTFTAGISDGLYGACAMILDKDRIFAKKSWFCFDEFIVALGAGIKASNNEPIYTTVNQVIKSGSILYQTDSSSNQLYQDSIASSKLSWVVHKNVGYYFPLGGKISVVQKKQAGSWKKINQSNKNSKLLSENVVTIAIDHGNKPTNSSYAYALFPNVDKLRVPTLQLGKLFQILRNDGNVQAVTNTKTNITQAVFYKVDTININKDIRIQPSSPCLLIIKKIKNELRLTVSNPMYNNLEIILEVFHNGHRLTIPFIFENCKVNGTTRMKKIYLN